MKLSLMLKPASSLCNLRCAYCFYHSLADMRACPVRGKMSLDMLDVVLDKAFDFADEGLYVSFQGGEPLLAGKEFFLHANDRLAGRKNTVLAVQTNGTLIDDEWAKIFKDGGWLAGVSLDGNARLNSYRMTADGKPAFEDTLRGIDCLQRAGTDFNILSVITRPTVKNIREIYAFFKERGFKYLQFIPCLKPLAGEEGALSEYPDEKEYAVFLKTLFSLYLADIKSGEYTSVRMLDNFVRLAHGKSAEQCGMNGCCSPQFVIEADGATYPCDFYCLDEYELGNISNDDFKSLANSDKAKAFVAESLKKPSKCKNCKYNFMCAGGCKRERIDIKKCAAYKEFFDFALEDMKNIY